jgi:LysR family transcriptional regulator, glycine cleavage system transcriptional activator
MMIAHIVFAAAIGRVSPVQQDAQGGKKPMTYKIPPLNALRAFEATARNLSFTKAASEMNVTQGAVSRQVRLLEDYLGFELFERLPRGVELNRTGQIYAAAVTEALEKIARATDELATVSTHTLLTIRGYTTLLVRWLTPLLPDFQLRHPNIEIRLVSAGDPVDFTRDKVDLGIRYGYGRWPNLERDALFMDELMPVCSPGLLQSLGIRQPSDLTRCTLLHLNLRPADWPDWFAAAAMEAPTPARAFHLEDLGVLYQCAIAGQGVAMGQLQYVREYLARGELVAPFDVILRRQRGYYLICPKERAGLSKIVTFRSWLRGVLSARGLAR